MPEEAIEMLSTHEFLHNSLQDWAIASGIFIVSFIVLKTLKNWMQSDGKPDSIRQQNFFFSVLRPATQKTYIFVIFTLALYFGSLALVLPATLYQALNIIVTISIFFQFIVWANSLIDHYAAVYRETRAQEDPTVATVLGLATFLAKIALMGILVLVALDQMGVNITAMVAGLGIGGVAIALALQNILSDLFSSLSIVLDKPFAVGDFLAIGDFFGTVEKVGLKTTRLRANTGELLIFPNTDLLQSRIRNYQNMNQRRLLFTFGVTYNTPYQKLKSIPDIVKSIIESQEMTQFDRAHFRTYGESSLDFEVVYFVTDKTFSLAMDIQQAINLELFKRFEEQGINFAFPTRTLYVEKENSQYR